MRNQPEDTRLYLAQNPQLQEFLVHLYRSGTVQIAEEGEPGFRFKLHEKNPEAPLSPIKIHLCTPDIRSEGRLTAEDVQQIGRFFAAFVTDEGFDVRAIAGLPNAGDPLARALRDAMRPQEVALLKLEKVVTDQGRRIGGLIDTDRYLPGGSVWIIDDLATHGDTKVEGASSLCAAGYPVEHCLVLLEYGPRPAQEMRARDIQLHALTTVTQLVDFLQERNEISSFAYRRTIRYIEENHRGSLVSVYQ